MNSSPRPILYFPYSIDLERQSASAIRPQKIITSFIINGYNPLIISGNAAKRKVEIKKLKKMLIAGYKFSFVYSESSTQPMLLTEEHHIPFYPLLDTSFFKLCKQYGIKIGVFYRDVQWRFPVYDRAVSKIKGRIAKIFYRYDLILYKKYIDIIYLPSLSMKKHLPELSGMTFKELPPGLDDCFCEVSKKTLNKNSINLFYSGGIMNIYDLMPTIELLNLNKHCKLTLVCRVEEWDIMKEKYLFKLNDTSQLCVQHVGRSEIPKLIEQCDLSIFALGEQAYLDFAIPFKIFDYLQFAKPILTLSGTAVANMVKEKGIGWVFDDIEAMDYFLEGINQSQIDYVITNMKKQQTENTWLARIKQVESELQ